MRALVVVVMVALAGCVEPAADVPLAGPEDADEAFDPSEPFQEAWTIADCMETAMALTIEPEHAQRHLPDGFVAGDAQDLFGFPVATGRALIAGSATSCAHSDISTAGHTEALIGITIQSPDIPTATEATVEFYMPGLGSATPEFRDLLTPYGFALIADQVRPEVAVTQATVQSASMVSDGDRLQYQWTMTGTVAAAELSGVYRWWQATPHGVGYLDYEVTADGHPGAIECAMRGVMAEVAEREGCVGPDAVAAVFSLDTVPTSFTWLGAVDGVSGAT